MSYTVLARKYRPQTFDELVGQEHVARTLGNAIDQGRVAHAFLFTGVRGVGKTTTARLLAKALNCEQGPTASPCNTCGPCIDITSGRDVDVQEIDGASNNSVDDVRRLQESLPYRPARDRFKIVIVDEVHMLSTGAFNAFLKTLEEPPAHVKFIFATTESHKVPITIRSRCQRYDFRLIPQAVVADRVRTLLGREGIEADDDAVALVAREAAGSMRDALTLLDQVVAFAGTKLVGVDVARMLGIAAREQVLGVVAALLSGDGRAVLEAVHAVTSQGVDPLHFTKQVLGWLRDLVVFRATGATGQLVDWVDEETAWAERTLEGVELAELERSFAMTSRVVDDVARSATPGMVLEMGLLRIATRPSLRSFEELFARLEALEARLGKGGDGGPPMGPGGGGPRTGRAAPPPSRRADAPVAAPREENAALAAAIALSSRGPGYVATVDVPAPSLDATPPRSEPREAFVARSEPARVPAFEPSPATLAALEVASSAEPARTRPSEPVRPVAPVTAPPEPTPASPSTPASEPSRASSGPTPLRRSALLEWEGIVAKLREAQPALSAVLEHGVPRIVTAERIVLAFQEGAFYGRQASQPHARDALLDAAFARLGTRPELEIRFDADPTQAVRTVAAVEAQRRAAELESKRKDALGHPRVLDALDVFPEGRAHTEVQFDEVT